MPWMWVCDYWWQEDSGTTGRVAASWNGVCRRASACSVCVILDKEPIIGQGTFTSLQRLVVSGSCRDFCLSMVSPHATFPAPRLYNYKLFLGCFQFHSLFPRSRRRSQQVIELMHGLKTASEFTVLLPFVCNCSHIKIFIYCTYSIYI